MTCNPKNAVSKGDLQLQVGNMSQITGTDAPDTLIGTSADDTIIGAAGSDYIDGAGGFNIAAYWTSPFGIRVRLFANIVDNDGFGAQDTLNNISGIAGTAFNDVIVGSDLGNYIQGFQGSDTVSSLGGDDLVRVSQGDDFVDGGEGVDRIFFGKRAEYVITKIADGFHVTDNVSDRDGSDTILNFELFQFTDTQLTAAELTDPNAHGDGLPYPRTQTSPISPSPTEPQQPSPGFGPMALRHGNFGASDSAGGWSSDDRFPRELADVNGDGRADIMGFGNAGVYVALAGDAWT
jgi:Ca2+-binding RTX toxin-like protein